MMHCLMRCLSFEGVQQGRKLAGEDELRRGWGGLLWV